MKTRIKICYYYDTGQNVKVYRQLKDNLLEDYLCTLEENSVLSYINKKKVSIYKKEIKSLVTVEILDRKDNIYKYISAGRFRKHIKKEIHNKDKD
jgi:hypothetical protein